MEEKIKKAVAAAAIYFLILLLPQQIFAAQLTEENPLNKTQRDAILPAPDTLTVDKTAYNAVVLSWAGVAQAAGYQIEYSIDGTEYTVAGNVSADILTYKCKKLLTGTAYRFRVCALDESNKLGNYALVTAQPFLKKPQIVSASAIQLHAVSIAWGKTAGAQSYELYRRAKGENAYQLLASTPELSYTDENVLTSQVYMYRIRAVRNVNGKIVYSKYSATVETASALPGVQLETCEALDYRSVRLTWQQPDMADGYYIYRSVKEDGAYKKIKTISNRMTLSYIDTGVVPAKTFYYKICAYVLTPDQQILPGEQSAGMMAKPQMEAPVLTAVTMNAANRTLALSWEKAADAAGYRVLRSQYPDQGFVKVIDIESGLANGYEDRSVAPGGTYYYRIRMLYKNKKYTGMSRASNICQGDMAPAAPIGLQIQQTAADTLQISWNPQAGAFSYNLYRADAAKGIYLCIAEGLSETAYADIGLKDNKTYYYRVSAAGAGGEGRKCFPVSFLTGGISLSTRTLKLCVGSKKQLELSTLRQGYVVWKSSDTSIAEVDSQGVVTGIAYGTVTVTAAVAGTSAAASVSVLPGIKNGIDVSRWQEEVDWCRVKKSGIDFAFLRITNHYLEDFSFETKYQDAVSVEMPVGVYCYSRAATVLEAQEEARTVLRILNGRKLDYPIALDMEDAVHKSAGMTKETLHEIILAFKQIVEDAGYRFVLYSYLTFFNTNLDTSRLDGIDIWIARYGNIASGTGYAGNGNVKYWQYNSGQYAGSNFHVDGVTDEADNLVEADVNIEYENTYEST